MVNAYTVYNEDTDDLDPFSDMTAEIKRDYREWAAQSHVEIAARAPYVCGVCGRQTHRIAQKRCGTCSAFFSKNGKERPPELWAQRRARRRVK